MPEVLGLEKTSPDSPIALAERCQDTADPLASFADSHIRIAPSGSKYEPCWFRRPAAEVDVLADVGCCEGCGESLSHPFSSLFQGVAGHGENVWAWRALPSSSPQFSCTCLSLNVSFVWGQPSC